MLSENTVATNYDMLQIISSISGTPIDCSWEIDSAITNFYRNNSCRDDLPSNNSYSSFCVKTEDSVTLTYTVLSPLLTNMSYFVSCFYKEEQVRNSTVVQVTGY